LIEGATSYSTTQERFSLIDTLSTVNQWDKITNKKKSMQKIKISVRLDGEEVFLLLSTVRECGRDIQDLKKAFPNHSINIVL
jgi:hypothetical protein